MNTSEKLLSENIDSNLESKSKDLIFHQNQPYYKAWLYIMIGFALFVTFYCVQIFRNETRYKSGFVTFIPLIFAFCFTAQFILQLRAIQRRSSITSLLAIMFITINLILMMLWTAYFGNELVKRTLNPPPPSESASIGKALSILFTGVGIIGLIIEGVTLKGAIKTRKFLTEKGTPQS